VVIEEDGKTEEEFIDELSSIKEELLTLSRSAAVVEKLTMQNISLIIGES